MTGPAPRVLVIVLLGIGIAGGVWSIHTAAETSTPQFEGEMPKVVVVVQDGAEWGVVNRLRKQGRLPHVDAMMDGGVYGDLKTPQAFSPQTWTKIGTGLSAANITIDDWVTKTGQETHPVTRLDVKSRRVWNYLEAAGIPIGVTNFLFTWPVASVRGFMVATRSTLADNATVHPEGLLSEAEQNQGEWAVANTVLSRISTLPAEEIPPFLVFGFKGSDAMQHALWRFLFPEEFGGEMAPEEAVYREAIYAEYERLDAFLSRFDASWNVIVVSDHGFAEQTRPNISTVEEFVPGTRSDAVVASTYAVTLNPLLAELGYAPPDSAAVDYTADVTWCPVPYDTPEALNQTAYHVNFCVQNDTLDVEKVVSRLNGVRYRNGRHVFEGLQYDPERETIDGRWRLFPGGVMNQTVTELPSEQGVFHENVTQVFNILGLQLPDGTPYNLWVGPEMSGDHPPGTNGIFIADGPAFHDRGRLQPGTVRDKDITPTLLYMYGLPIPRAMDGKPVTSLFTDAFNAKRTIRYADTPIRKNETGSHAVIESERAETLKDRLRDLGYLR